MHTDPASAPDLPDSKERFAADLRALRLAAGKPILTALAQQTGISKTSISDAFAGRKLPTENTLEYLIPVLGGDLPAWLRRRAALDPRQADKPAVKPARGAPRQISMVAALSIALVAALASAGTTSLIWHTAAPQVDPIVAAEQPAPDGVADAGDYVDFEDGVDPMETICREDSVIAASEERLDGAVLVQMLYSNRCMAVWGRVTRYDGDAAGNSVSMTIFPATDFDSDRNQSREAFDVQSLYTPMMLEPDVAARVCGLASITAEGEHLELGPPLCV